MLPLLLPTPAHLVEAFSKRGAPLQGMLQKQVVLHEASQAHMFSMIKKAVLLDMLTHHLPKEEQRDPQMRLCPQVRKMTTQEKLEMFESTNCAVLGPITMDCQLSIYVLSCAGIIGTLARCLIVGPSWWGCFKDCQMCD